MKSQKRIFLSHSSDDNRFADSIVCWLKAYGFDDIWYDNQNLSSGKLADIIGREITLSQVFVVLLSPQALESDWVTGEYLYALTLAREGVKLDIIPIIVKPCIIPIPLNNYKYLDLTQAKDPIDVMMELMKMIEGQEPSTVHPTMKEQAVLELTFQETLKPGASKFTINMGNIQANTI